VVAAGFGGPRWWSGLPGAMQSFIQLNNSFNTLISMMQVGLDMAPTPAQIDTSVRPTARELQHVRSRRGRSAGGGISRRSAVMNGAADQAVRRRSLRVRGHRTTPAAREQLKTTSAVTSAWRTPRRHYDSGHPRPEDRGLSFSGMRIDGTAHRDRRSRPGTLTIDMWPPTRLTRSSMVTSPRPRPLFVRRPRRSPGRRPPP
jgi:hypothetical protein